MGIGVNGNGMKPFPLSPRFFLCEDGFVLLIMTIYWYKLTHTLCCTNDCFPTWEHRAEKTWMFIRGINIRFVVHKDSQILVIQIFEDEMSLSLFAHFMKHLFFLTNYATLNKYRSEILSFQP